MRLISSRASSKPQFRESAFETRKTQTVKTILFQFAVLSTVLSRGVNEKYASHLPDSQALAPKHPLAADLYPRERIESYVPWVRQGAPGSVSNQKLELVGKMISHGSTSRQIL